jgi:cation diffusion facilitator CzcD-associated flavoprotein CzcO
VDESSVAADGRNTQWPRIAIVGAGLGGIAAAAKLRMAGYSNLRVFEASPGPGGTWWTNRYAGCEVDTTSQAYSYSFLPYPWKSTHATQPELVEYSEHIIDHFGMRDDFRFNCALVEARWDGAKRKYIASLSTGEQEEFDVLVSAVGMFSVPNIPAWARTKVFEGLIVHSSDWPESIDIAGKRVAVVGTGSTACQLVPAIAETAASVLVFQREPGWIVPKPVVIFGEAERHRRIRQRWRDKLRRAAVYYTYAQAALKGYRVGSRLNRRNTQLALSYLESAVHDPEVRRALTPGYPFGCKRVIKATGYYEAFNRDNVTLVPTAVETMTKTGLVDASSREHEVDIVVLATGYRATDYLDTLPVTRSNGASLREKWAGDPRAYLGVTVPGFPNLFLLYGPNTNGGGPITGQHERQIEFIIRAFNKAEKARRHVIDTDEKALDSFVKYVDRANGRLHTAVSSGCHNYYTASSGRNVTQWPSSHLRYAWMLWRGIKGLRFSE